MLAATLADRFSLSYKNVLTQCREKFWVICLLKSQNVLYFPLIFLFTVFFILQLASSFCAMMKKSVGVNLLLLLGFTLRAGAMRKC